MPPSVESLAGEVSDLRRKLSDLVSHREYRAELDDVKNDVSRLENKVDKMLTNQMQQLQNQNRQNVISFLTLLGIAVTLALGILAFMGGA